MKNWREKDCRLFSQGENPHSKGFNLFISKKDFFIKTKINPIIRRLKAQDRNKICLKIIIKDNNQRKKQGC